MRNSRPPQRQTRKRGSSTKGDMGGKRSRQEEEEDSDSTPPTPNKQPSPPANQHVITSTTPSNSSQSSSSSEITDGTTKPHSTTDLLQQNLSQNSGSASSNQHEKTITAATVPRRNKKKKMTSSSTAPIHHDENDTKRVAKQNSSKKSPRKSSQRTTTSRREPLPTETRKQQQQTHNKHTASLGAPPKKRMDEKLTVRDELDFDDDDEDESSSRGTLVPQRLPSPSRNKAKTTTTTVVASSHESSQSSSTVLSSSSTSSTTVLSSMGQRKHGLGNSSGTKEDSSSRPSSRGHPQQPAVNASHDTTHSTRILQAKPATTATTWDELDYDEDYEAQLLASKKGFRPRLFLASTAQNHNNNKKKHSTIPTDTTQQDDHQSASSRDETSVLSSSSRSKKEKKKKKMALQFQPNKKDHDTGDDQTATTDSGSTRQQQKQQQRPLEHDVTGRSNGSLSMSSSSHGGEEESTTTAIEKDSLATSSQSPRQNGPPQQQQQHDGSTTSTSASLTLSSSSPHNGDPSCGSSSTVTDSGRWGVAPFVLGRTKSARLKLRRQQEQELQQQQQQQQQSNQKDPQHPNDDDDPNGLPHQSRRGLWTASCDDDQSWTVNATTKESNSSSPVPSYSSLSSTSSYTMSRSRRTTRRRYVNAPTTRRLRSKTAGPVEEAMADDNDDESMAESPTGPSHGKRLSTSTNTTNGGVGVNVYDLQDDGQLQLLTDEVTFLCEGFWENIQSGSILELAWLLSLERNRKLLCKSHHEEEEPSAVAAAAAADGPALQAILDLMGQLPVTLLHHQQPKQEPSLLTNTPEDALLPLSCETTSDGVPNRNNLSLQLVAEVVWHFLSLECTQALSPIAAERARSLRLAILSHPKALAGLVRLALFQQRTLVRPLDNLTTRDAPDMDSTLSPVQKRPMVDHVALKLKQESPTDPITSPESQSSLISAVSADPTVAGREYRRQNRTRGRGSKREPPPSTINGKKREEDALLVSQRRKVEETATCDADLSSPQSYLSQTSLLSNDPTVAGRKRRRLRARDGLSERELMPPPSSLFVIPQDRAITQEQAAELPRVTEKELKELSFTSSLSSRHSRRGSENHGRDASTKQAILQEQWSTVLKRSLSTMSKEYKNQQQMSAATFSMSIPSRNDTATLQATHNPGSVSQSSQLPSNLTLLALQRILTGRLEGHEKSCLDESNDKGHNPTMVEDDESDNPLIITNRILAENETVIELLAEAMAQTVSQASTKVRLNEDKSNSSDLCIEALHERITILASVIDGACLFHDGNRQSFCSALFEDRNTVKGKKTQSLIPYLLDFLKAAFDLDKDTLFCGSVSWIGGVSLEVLKTLTSLTHENNEAVSIVTRAEGWQILAQILYAHGQVISLPDRHDDLAIFALNTLANLVESSASTEPTSDKSYSSIVAQLKVMDKKQEKPQNVSFVAWLVRHLVDLTASFQDDLLTEGEDNSAESAFGSQSDKEMDEGTLKEQDRDNLLLAGNGFVFLAYLLVGPLTHSSKNRRRDFEDAAILEGKILDELPGSMYTSKLRFLQKVLYAFCNVYRHTVGELSVAIIAPVQSLMQVLREKVRRPAAQHPMARKSSS